MTSPRPYTSGVNTETAVLDTAAGRILCIADVRGKLSSLNQLASDANAVAIIHTGDFGFFEISSVDRISDRTLRHLVSYSPLIDPDERPALLAPDAAQTALRSSILNNSRFILSEFPQLLAGELALSVPVYTVWGACEDVVVLENFRQGTYSIPNLHIIDEATTRRIDVGGVSLRLLGLGGALVPHKLFDNGDGRATIAGGQGTMWATVLQLGELLDTARRVYDASETRLLVTHASPGREGILAQLALAVRADLTVSAGLHFRHATSYNEFSVQEDADGFRAKLLKGKESFDRVWENVKAQVEAVIDDRQRTLLENALTIIERVPPPAPTGPNPTGAIPGEEPAWKNCWNWNLCDASYGSLVLDIKDGRISAELKSQGFNYAYRKNNQTQPQPQATNNVNTTTRPPTTTGSPAPTGPKSKLGTDGEGTKPATPAPGGTKPATPAGTKPGTPAPAGGSGGTKPGTPVNGVGAKRAGKRGSVDSNKPATGTASPAVGESSLPENGEAAGEPKSLDAVKSQDGRSTGAQTPPTTGPRRHPWTLYVRPLPIPVGEDELREFFKDAVEGITSIKIPIDFKHPQQPQRGFAYVEFTDEEAMRAGLEKRGDTIRDTKPNVEISNPTDHSSSFRGRGGPGRGGFGGGRGRGAGGGGGGGGGAGGEKWGANAGRSVMQAVAAAAGPGGSVAGRPGGQGKGGQGGK
ncbi:hypothetical protein FRC12_011441 [Ceratobasidium sp. 428]|nr:hypothetical protein FRC12_011441 [Ceratobasidium sp. 428]